MAEEVEYEVQPTDVWLASGTFDYGQLRGKLAITGGRLVYWPTDAVDSGHARFLEELTGVQGIGDRLQSGESLTVIDVPADQADVKFPKSAMAAELKLKLNGKHVRIYFYDAGKGAQPLHHGTAVAGTFTGAAASKPFRQYFKSVKG